MIWIILGSVFGAIALIALFIYLNNNLLSVSRYSFDFKLNSPVKIVHLSDLHGKTFGAHNCRLVAKVAAEKPDIIAITGDIVHRYSPKNKRAALELVSTLAQVAPVLYVSGNHEMRNKGYRFFRKDLKEAGAIVLDDETSELCGVTIAGLNCASLKNGKIDEITPNSSPKILLAHMPHYFETYRAAGYDLVLCGHAHGGQWRIPFTRIGLYAPGQGVFPKYVSGEYKKGDTSMIVSRGLGNSEFPVRLFNLPEICVITLQ